MISNSQKLTEYLLAQIFINMADFTLLGSITWGQKAFIKI